MARGGSTITQQLAKNLYLSPSRNPIRKLREFLIARKLEAALAKRRIFEIYLNVIEWGDGIYGADAAARRYFGKSAGALSPEEAALMAGAIINPRVHNPARPTARLRVRQQIILKRMGWVDDRRKAPELPEALPAPVVPVPQLPVPKDDGPVPREEAPPQQLPPSQEEKPEDQPTQQQPQQGQSLTIDRHRLAAFRRSSIVTAVTLQRQLIREIVGREVAADPN